ncbi:hypothetical protein B0H16DRAFT_1577742 [Mycena metata]|uniref:Transmembrane protein n=1 Tax=Mycena metata TaxID=1033252 RepID=A0AAD7MVZ1_9AGAR|nr:hypothetical protein B0H16DRAFT_1577742 [Mycena metata]
MHSSRVCTISPFFSFLFLLLVFPRPCILFMAGGQLALELFAHGRAGTPTHPFPLSAVGLTISICRPSLASVASGTVHVRRVRVRAPTAGLSGHRCPAVLFFLTVSLGFSLFFRLPHFLRLPASPSSTAGLTQSRGFIWPPILLAVFFSALGGFYWWSASFFLLASPVAFAPCLFWVLLLFLFSFFSCLDFVALSFSASLIAGMRVPRTTAFFLSFLGRWSFSPFFFFGSASWRLPFAHTDRGGYPSCVSTYICRTSASSSSFLLASPFSYPPFHLHCFP